MAITLLQQCSWPGVVGVESLTGTVSHGITPSTWVLTCYPQAAVPEAFGTLVIGDGFRRLVLPDCKVDTITGRAGGDGQVFILTIQDRRWRWRFGAISGRYNQLDNRGKLIPWTIRSPTELAVLCLEAMGEKNYRINLPAGLSRTAGANLDRYLLAGENFPQSLTNPPVVWDATPPAEALARLADLYGCRVIYQPIANRVLVAPVGEGRVKLPDGPCEMIAPALVRPAIPKAVGVAGAPVRIQCRFLLEAVGKEWDGKYLPINDLSYAPQSQGKVQISTVTYTGPDVGAASSSVSVKVTVTYQAQWNPPTGDPVSLEFAFSGTEPVETKLARVAAAIRTHDELSKLVTANLNGAAVTITGRQGGFPFQVTAETSASPPHRLVALNTQNPELPGGTWEACPPPTFAGVKATDRLSYDEAKGLARSSVFRCYRIRNVDPTSGKPPLKLPWFGPVKRRQQVILQPTKVQQVMPAERIKGGAEKNIEIPKAFRDRFGLLPEFYNGYSRDREATVHGAIDTKIGSVLWDSIFYNTGSGDRVYVPFTIDPVEQLVVFSEYVYRYWPEAGTCNVIRAPSLTLETACLVQDAETGEIVRWKEIMNLGGEAPIEWTVHDDVQVEVIATYEPKSDLTGDKNKLTGWGFYDHAQARARARYYLEGEARKFQLSGGESRQYIGIHLIDLDGAVQQVSWSIGPGGATTVASTNSEHSAVIPDYPARRRYENLPPNKSARIANEAEDKLIKRIPKPPGM